MSDNNPSHPEHTLRENALSALPLTVTEAAKQLGVTRAALPKTLCGRAPSCRSWRYASKPGLLPSTLHTRSFGPATRWPTTSARHSNHPHRELVGQTPNCPALESVQEHVVGSLFSLLFTRACSFLRKMDSSKPSVQRYGQELAELFAENRMVVFLCGPSLNSDQPSPGSKLREKLQKQLDHDEFEVVLGEDDGLESLRKRYTGYAHENELNFLLRECGAVVIIADSVGSYCELGLFAYCHPRQSGTQLDMILIIDKKYQTKTSYLNKGPAKAVADFGKVYYEDLETFDGAKVIERLKRRRTVYFVDGRGRPSR